MSSPTGIPNVPARPALVRVVAIGCFMAWIGAFSGAMIAVLIAKGVAYFGKLPTCQGIPTCDWYIYAGVGAAIGAISLPWLVVSALRRPQAPADSTPDEN